MPVRFILGRSGTGKTHYCLEQVRAGLRPSPEGPALILLAPEQATFQIERELIQTPGLPGYHRARVLSFRRFAHLLFNELGGPTFPPISPLAKQMALRAVLEPLRTRLPTFAASLDRPGFLVRLADTFREFHQYQVSSAQLRDRAAVERRERLKRKLLELADAFDAFNDYLRRARFTDLDAALTLSAERLGDSRLARGASAWVDGFAGFTPQELAFLGELAAVVERVEIALVLDPSGAPRFSATADAAEPPAGRLFRRTEQTYLRLRRLFADKGVPVGKPVTLVAARRFATTSPLAVLESGLFDAGGPAKGAAPVSQRAAGPSDAPASPARLLLDHRDDELVLVEAPDRRAEVRAAANQIRHLVERFGYRYRQVAVILRSLDDYWQFVVEAFEDAAIPYFIDRRQPVSHHPLVELLRSVASTVARRLAPADVIAFLKTDLPSAAVDGVPPGEVRDAIDRVENYALAYGLAGTAWFHPDSWRFHESTAFGQEDLADHPPPDGPVGMARMVSVATACLAPLEELHESVAAAGGRPTVRQWTAALWRLLVRLDVGRTLESWSAAGDSRAGGAGSTDVHAQVFEAVARLLADLSVALGASPMDGGQFAAVLEAGLSQLTLGLVPPALDQVLVGAIERSRHPQIKAALVLGMAERSFPRLRPVQSILTDDDRQQLAHEEGAGNRISDLGSPISDSRKDRPTQAGQKSAPARPVELAPPRGELLFDEDLMAYLALTRPSERLWVSYPAADDAGRPVVFSRYVRRLRDRFPTVPVVRLAEEHPALSAVTGGELAGALAGGFANVVAPARPAALDADLYELLRGSAPEPLARAMSSLSYANEPVLSAALARRLFARRGVLAGSVTRLESFAACPFQHLAGFGLALAPRERLELDALQLGRFYHELLRQLFERLGPGPVDWSARPAAELRRLVAELVASARDRLTLPVLSGGAAGYVLDGARQVVGDLAEAMHAAAAAAVGVRQVAAELVFGDPKRGLAALTLPLDDAGARVALRGKIDRVDLADDGSLFVIDYKTGYNAVDWSGLYHGLSLQLLVYLLALEQNAARLAKQLARSGSRRGPIRPAGAFFQRIAVRPASDEPPPSDAPEPDPRWVHESYQRRGLFVADAARVLDGGLTPGGSSPFVRIRLKKDGAPSASGADAVSGEELAALMRWAAEWIGRLGRSILSGNVAVRPYRLGNRSPCSWCDYRGVCRLDFDYNLPRYLDGRKRSEVLAEVMADEKPEK